MIGQWLSRRPDNQMDSRVVPLKPADVDSLDLGWKSFFNAEELRWHMHRYPNRSFWVPATREYVIGGYWRHRAEIGSVVELGARGEQRRPLIEALMTACTDDGCPLVIFNDTSELRQIRWYADLGFEMVQEIIVYELNGLPQVSRSARPQLVFEEVTGPTDDLLMIDRQAFPFLWWNCREEFANYLDQSGVRIYLGRSSSGEPVAYCGITLYHGWGHLDRLAVTQAAQGRGLGLETLTHAVNQVLAHGARRTGLSTQADNYRSQRLYERVGFRRTYRTDYQLYGRWLTDDPERRRQVLGTAM